jgi:uncharacterized membrane protein YuzA (DUF378 family)
MEINFVVTLLVAIVLALTYGFVGFFAANLKDGETYDWKKLAATIIYSVVVGILGTYAGVFTLTNVSLEAIAPIWATYIGFLYIVQTVIEAIFKQAGYEKGIVSTFSRE